MTILVTGGSPMIRSRLVNQLKTRGCSILLASKTGVSDDSGVPGVVFSWQDPTTWAAALTPDSSQTSPITAVYVSVVGLEDGYDAATTFINTAREKGVQRFVFSTNFMLDEDGSSWYSRVHVFLQSSGVEWAILRPSWFMQTFSEEQRVHPIQLESRIVSGTEEGRLPFVDCEDFAAVAAEALIREQSFDRDLMVVGPEALNYAEIARILTEVVGREISWSRLTPSGMAEYLKSKGAPGAMADLWGETEARVSQGLAANLQSDVNSVLDRPPRSFRDFAIGARHLWIVEERKS